MPVREKVGAITRDRIDASQGEGRCYNQGVDRCQSGRR
jgi:hypothetical protein